MVWLQSYNPTQDLSVNPRSFIKQKVNSAKNELKGLSPKQTTPTGSSGAWIPMKPKVAPSIKSSPEISAPSLANVSASLPQVSREQVMQSKAKHEQILKPQPETQQVSNINIDKSLADLTADMSNVVKEGRTPDMVKLKQLYPEFSQVEDSVLADLTADLANVAKEWRQVDMNRLKELYPELSVQSSNNEVVEWGPIEYGNPLSDFLSKTRWSLKERGKEAFQGNIDILWETIWAKEKSKSFLDSTLRKFVSPEKRMLLNSLWSIAWFGNDAIGNIISSSIPEPAKERLGETASKLLDNDSIKVLAEGIQNGMETYDSRKQKNPGTAKGLESLFNIGSLIPIWGATNKVWQELTEQALKTGAKKWAKETLEQAWKQVAASTDWVFEKTADKIIQNMNRITKGEQQAFEAQQGVSMWERLRKRGIIEKPENTIEKLGEWFMKSKWEAEKWLDTIPGRYQNPMLEEMLKDVVRHSDETLNPEAMKMKGFLKEYADEGWLTMKEANKVQQYYQRNNKFWYGKDFTNAEKVTRATNIDNAVRERKFDIAEQNGFTNLKQINKETQAAKFLLDKISKNFEGFKGNNLLSLTDWIVAGQWLTSPAAMATLLGKKVASSSWFKTGAAKLLSRLSKSTTIEQRIADINNIMKITSEKELNAFLNAKALPYKEGVPNTFIPGGDKIISWPNGSITKKGIYNTPEYKGEANVTPITKEQIELDAIMNRGNKSLPYMPNNKPELLALPEKATSNLWTKKNPIKGLSPKKKDIVEIPRKYPLKRK